MTLPIIKKEYSILSAALLLFLSFPEISRHIDISSAPIDPGILSAVLISVLAFLSFKSLTWLLIKSVWPVLAAYSESSFESNFLSLTPLHKVLIYLSFYLLLLYGFVLTMTAII